MKRNDRDFLNEILASERLDDFRRASLEFGLSAIRQRRRRRTLARNCVLVAAPVLAALVMLWFHNGAKPGHMSASSALDLPVAGNPSSNDDLKIIDDDQLFALFPNRALALVGKPGRQQLVFLDQVQAPPPQLTR